MEGTGSGPKVSGVRLADSNEFGVGENLYECRAASYSHLFEKAVVGAGTGKQHCSDIGDDHSFVLSQCENLECRIVRHSSNTSSEKES